MKKLLFVYLSLLLLTGTVFAQSQQADQKTEQNAVKKQQYFLMKDGNMLHNMDGKEMQMHHDMTFKNGTMMKTDGSYLLKNGKQAHLRDGQCMDMNGQKFNSERMLQRNMQGNHGMGMQDHNMHSGGNNQNMNGSGSSHH